MEYFTVPDIDTYFGGKGGAGVYQTIINQLPPHDVFHSGFLGHCAITRYKKPALRTYGHDMDPKVIAAWNRAELTPEGQIYDCGMCQWTVANTIKTLGANHTFGPNELWYLDPPYLHETRKDQRNRYNYEMSRAEHLELLHNVQKHNCLIAISHYPCQLYDDMLLSSGWRYIDFQARTRGGSATERLYMNYPVPAELHDYSYLGDNFKAREHIKLKFERWKNGLDQLSTQEVSMRKDYISSYHNQLLCIY